MTIATTTSPPAQPLTVPVATPPAPPLMQIDSVRFAFRRHQPVLTDITAEVVPGRVHVILGPNGSGKTTLLRLLLGELRPTSGRIRMGGRKLPRWRARRRAAWMSYVPQRSSAAFSFTVRDVVRMGRFALPNDDVAVERAIDACDVRDLADRPANELSVGQQQRVLLCRAMAQAAGDGRVMLLDEPTSAMDLNHVHRTMRMLRSLAAEGLAVVVVVQDINLASRYADRVWLLDRGRLVADGEWDIVLDPSVLEPVYQVRVEPVQRAGQPRPMFDIQLPEAPWER